MTTTESKVNHCACEECMRLREVNTDLYAACEGMLKSLDGPVGDFVGMLNCHRAIEAAVRKARGEEVTL